MFLISYLIHHARVGSVPYQGTGVMRVVYFAILIPHVILAASVVPLAIVTLRFVAILWGLTLPAFAVPDPPGR